jgi:hypothetical protein
MLQRRAVALLLQGLYGLGQPALVSLGDGTGDHIFILFGNYNGRFRIWRPMTLHAQGGPVTAP